jgi:hypothetical protein
MVDETSDPPKDDSNTSSHGDHCSLSEEGKFSSTLAEDTQRLARLSYELYQEALMLYSRVVAITEENRVLKRQIEISNKEHESS